MPGISMLVWGLVPERHEEQSLDKDEMIGFGIEVV